MRVINFINQMNYHRMTKKGRNQLIIVILSTNVNHSYNTLSFKKQHDCIRLNADSQFYQTITSGFCQLISSKSIIHRTKLPVLLEHQSDFIPGSFVSTPFDTCMLFLNNFIFRDKSTFILCQDNFFNHHKLHSYRKEVSA